LFHGQKKFVGSSSGFVISELINIVDLNLVNLVLSSFKSIVFINIVDLNLVLNRGKQYDKFKN
tara:strand:- start:1285 stop:1473 length:189 start_codon:yes stop_codon:yes gene_type:complete